MLICHKTVHMGETIPLIPPLEVTRCDSTCDKTIFSADFSTFFGHSFQLYCYSRASIAPDNIFGTESISGRCNVMHALCCLTCTCGLVQKCVVSKSGCCQKVCVSSWSNACSVPPFLLCIIKIPSTLKRLLE